MALQDVLRRMRNVRQNGNGYEASCPIHTNEEQIVRIWTDEQGRVELQCKAGCGVKWIRDALQLTDEDLSPASSQGHKLKTNADPVEDSKKKAPLGEKGTSGEQRPQSAATRLVEIASVAEFFHSPEKECFARIPVDDHYENWPVKSNDFRRWLSGRFYKCFKNVPSGQAIQDALGLLEGRALFDGYCQQIHRRVAEHEGSIYLNLCDQKWRSIEITSNGWNITTDTPVKFYRARGMLALPEPQRGGSINDLWQFYNVEPADRVMTIALLHSYYRPRGPYPICAMQGEQGTAKSTNARVLRHLIDPNVAPLRCEPRNARELMITANNNWIITLDNLSIISEWLSDALCRLATGGGFSTRELYSDNEEVIFNAQRPIILTGIENVVTRNDLLDRSIVFDLPIITDKNRRAEEEFWRDFENVRPGIIGAFLNAVSTALQNVSDVKLDNLPRMADFAIWVTAAEQKMGFDKGEFIKAYTSNRQLANAMALEGSPISSAVIKLMDQAIRWEGTATELLSELDNLVSDGAKRLQSWPKSPKILSGVLKRLAPNLRAAGISFTYKRTGSRRIIFVEKKHDSSSLVSSLSPGIENQRITNEFINDNVTQSDYNVKQKISSLSPAKFIETKEELSPDEANDDNDANKQVYSCDACGCSTRLLNGHDQCNGCGHYIAL